MKVIVDTNVAVVANERNTAADPECVLTCINHLQAIQKQHILVLDDQWRIIREYMAELRSEGQPGVGDAFLKWVLTNQKNPNRCTFVHITPVSGSEDENDFVEFPDDVRLAKFDRADRKFVAVARSHPEHPPIYNATDTDWIPVSSVLLEYDVMVEFLCPEEIFR